MRANLIPTKRLVLLLFAASIVVAILPLPSLWSLAVVDGLILIAFVVDAFLSVSPKAIVLTREMPEIVTIGTTAEVNWTVHNSSAKSVTFSLADDFPPSFDAAQRVLNYQMGAGESRLASTTIKPTRRGRFELGSYTVRIEGPLHLAARQGRNQSDKVLMVYPSFKSRAAAELRIEKARILDVGLRSARAHGGGTEFDQLREYTADDDFRRLDWAATVRANKPIVRTYRAERNQNISILLDSGRMMAGRVADVPRLETAMDAVMALSTVALRLGDRVGLTAFDDLVEAEVASGTGNSHMARITAAMYRLEPRLVESDYRSAFLHSLARNRRRSLVVILTELSAYGIAETLMPALPLMLRHHAVIIASVRDPAVTEWATAIPTEVNKAFRKAAAVSSLAERHSVIARLRGLGVVVVDATPDQLGAQLADAYLDIKARGSL